MFGASNVRDVRCLGCRIFRMWNVRDAGCFGCKMFGIWDLGCLPGCGMLIYKMPINDYKIYFSLKSPYQLHCWPLVKGPITKSMVSSIKKFF